MTETSEATLKQRVQNGEQVEPSENLPEEYKQAAQRMIQFHANSEIMGTVAGSLEGLQTFLNRRGWDRRRARPGYENRSKGCSHSLQ